MGQYDICTNYLEIIAGTNNRITRAYQEAAQQIDSDNMKSMAYLKNFITSIESLASKTAARDKDISNSKGNIKNMASFDNIKTVMDFLKKNLGEVKSFKDVTSIYDSLEKYQPQYVDGYSKNVRLVMLEYESAVYMLLTGVVKAMTNDIDFVQTGTKVSIKRKSSDTHGTINDITSKLAAELRKPGHKEYLETLIKAVDAKPIDTDVKTKEPEKTEEVKESVLYESAVTDTMALIGAIFGNVGKVVRLGFTGIRAVKNSVFGIVPLIRSILYMKYKRKADRIAAIDQQVIYLQNNIEQLQNRKGDMDPKKKEEVVKKQQAALEAYKKRAEKLRAELMEEEKDAATAIKNEDPQMKNIGDGEFVLEGVKISEVFTENEDESEENEGSEEPEEPLEKPETGEEGE